jgi:uncharacterized membrane protein YdbT with pleckstrin-like domain
MNNNQKLGIKVFYYYLSKKVMIGFVFLIISFIISSLREAIILKLIYIISLDISILLVKYFIDILFIISTLFILYGVVISWIKYISFSFNLGETALSISHGLFTKKEVSIPYRQIQNINIEQTFNLKIMGISKLVILTAGNDDDGKNGEAEGIFEIIDSDLAQKIKEQILVKSNIQPISNSIQS